MNINIHNNPGTQSQMIDASFQANPSKEMEGAKALQGNDKGLVVSEGSESAPVEAVPPWTLDRNDALGKLVNSVYGFEAPPFPSEIPV